MDFNFELKDLLRIASKTRQAQKAYYSARKKGYANDELKIAKGWEAALDAKIQYLDEQYNNPKLPF